jgi:hypothetical protein
MFRSDRALNIVAPSHSDDFAERFNFAHSRQDGSAVFMQTRKSLLTEFINGLCKILLTVAVLGLVGIGGVLALDEASLRTEAEPAVVASVINPQSRELNRLRSEVALLTEQSLELRSELALLTGQGGVLPRMVARLQEQRKVNGAHSNAIRQLYSTTGLISASLPLADEGATAESPGSRPVQVTPVAAPQADTPKRVVLISERGTQAHPKTEGGEGE